MNSTHSRTSAALTTVGILLLFCAAAAVGQVKTHSHTASGEPIREVTVQSATVVLVDGDDLVVKYPDGSLRHFPDVPESFRASVDGQDFGIHDLKPGMTLQRTVIKSTTPQTITTVQSVTGKIWHVTPPHGVILTLEDGTNQSFKIPTDQKFNVNGRVVDAWGLKKGMKISATRIVEVPQTLVSHDITVTGTAPPPQSPQPDQPILVAILHRPTPIVAPGPAPAEESAQLPKTGSELPLIGLLGLICLGSSVGLRLIRR